MLASLLTGPRNEAEAARVATSDNALRRAWLGVRAGFALARDPNDTQQVFYLAYSVDRYTLPLVVERMRAQPSGRALMERRATIDSRHVDYAALRVLPADTLGGAYARMLKQKALDPDLFQPPPGLPEDLSYVAQRARQTHDLWHVLTGLDTDVAGESALQAFTYEQLHQNFSKLIVGFGLVLFGRRYPQMRAMVERARRAGAATPFLLAVPWEEHWGEPLEQVRARFGLVEAASELTRLSAGTQLD